MEPKKALWTPSLALFKSLEFRGPFHTLFCFMCLLLASNAFVMMYVMFGF